MKFTNRLLQLMLLMLKLVCSVLVRSVSVSVMMYWTDHRLLHVALSTFQLSNRTKENHMSWDYTNLVINCKHTAQNVSNSIKEHVSYHALSHLISIPRGNRKEWLVRYVVVRTNSLALICRTIECFGSYQKSGFALAHSIPGWHWIAGTGEFFVTLCWYGWSRSMISWKCAREKPFRILQTA